VCSVLVDVLQRWDADKALGVWISVPTVLDKLPELIVKDFAEYFKNGLPGTLPAPTAPAHHLNSSILRKASRSANEEKIPNTFPIISGWYLETSAGTSDHE
jgi:hypothetical protein